MPDLAFLGLAALAAWGWQESSPKQRWEFLLTLALTVAGVGAWVVLGQHGIRILGFSTPAEMACQQIVRGGADGLRCGVWGVQP